MLKKRYLAIAGLAVLAIAASGCGKKNTKEQTPVQVTPTETPQATPTVTIELVNMEETTEKNVIGEKTATASKVAIVNRTGSEIALSISERHHLMMQMRTLLTNGVMIL